MSLDKEISYAYWPLCALSYCSFLFAYKYISPPLSHKYFPGYRDLDETKKIDWNNRVMSTIHAVAVSFVCLYAIVYENQLDVDPIWGHSFMVKCNTAIVTGYMLSDTTILLVHYSKIGEIGYIFHHFASCYAFYHVFSYGVLSWFANFRLIAEFSTAFVNQRWFLDVLGYEKTSGIFMANGIAMAAMFFMVRVVPIVPYWYKVFSIYDTPPANALGHMFWVMILSCAILDILNVLWFNKIYRGAKKILRQASDENKNYKAKAA